MTERRFVAAVFLLYAAVTLFTALHHERWRDEADVWLLLRDGGVETMLARTGYVGSPALWYLLVGALVKLGLPYGSMTILNLVIAAAAVLLFLIAAPFSRTLRALFALSFYPAYEYAVIARQYALVMLLLFAALAARRNHPFGFAICLALIANTTVHGLIFAVILGTLYVRTRATAAMVLLGCVLAIVQLMPPADAPAGHVLRSFDPSNAAIAIGNAFFPRVPVVIGFVCGVVVLLAIMKSIGRVPRLFLIVTTAALLGVYVFVWFGALRHSGLILLAAVGALWLQGSAPRMLNAALAISVVVSLFSAAQDIREPFSGAREMAEYLETHGLADVDIAAHRAAPAAAVLAYLPPRQFFYAGMQRYGSYMLWDDAQRRGARMSYEASAALARRHFGGRAHLLLLNGELPYAERRGYRLLHETRRPYRVADERFLLYEMLFR